MRFIARFAKEKDEFFEIVDVFEEKTKRQTIAKTDPRIKTLSRKYPSAIWFERKMQDDFGIVIEDAFDHRPLVHHERFPKQIHPLRKSFEKKTIQEAGFTPYKYEQIKGDSVFCVSVGPVHAGIIEPGHFHFSQAGEDMLHLEVRHFYKHRAIEKMVEGKTLFEAKPIIERISGNESVAYQLCWRDIVLGASKVELPLAKRRYDALVLELERIAHHCTDLGFIANDAGFGAALAFSSVLAEKTRRKLAEISGNRFGFGAIDFKAHTLDVEAMGRWVVEMEKEIEEFEDWIIDIPSLWDRFDTTGAIHIKKALKYSCVGVVARAAGVAIDRRLNRFYTEHGFVMASETTGDVAARFKVRLFEVKNSLAMIKNFLEKEIPEVKITNIDDGEYFSYAESSLGEVFMGVELKEGKIERFFVRDPSFINWQALHIMMQRDIIADFPLINKSCDLSYAGSDL